MGPGTTLAPGAYTFRLAEMAGSRNVIQIWNEDETKLIATAMAIPAARHDPKGDVVVTIQRTAPEAAPALKSWFYSTGITIDSEATMGMIRPRRPAACDAALLHLHLALDR